jgi:hypothetical protein
MLTNAHEHCNDIIEQAMARWWAGFSARAFFGRFIEIRSLGQTEIRERDHAEDAASRASSRNT